MTTSETELQSGIITDKAETTRATSTPVKVADKQAPSSGARKLVKAPPRKPDIILKLIKRSKGARIEDLQKATGWQAHSIRAALTGLRKKGIPIELNRTASGKVWYKAVEG